MLRSSRHKSETVGERNIGQDCKTSRLQRLSCPSVETRPIKVESAFDCQKPVHRRCLDAVKDLSFTQVERELVIQAFLPGPPAGILNLLFRNIDTDEPPEFASSGEKEILFATSKSYVENDVLFTDVRCLKYLDAELFLALLISLTKM